MADLSIAVLVGRLTRDAELKYTNSGQPVGNFSVATSTRRKKGDQWVDEPSFWDVELWGKQAESLNQYLTKGKLVAVEGTMRQDRWEQDGQQRMKVKVSANSVQLLGGGQGNNGWQGGNGQGDNAHRDAAQYGSHGNDQGRPQGREPARHQADGGPDDFADDIPF
jgi:single-strand DNA-binding protein